MPTPTHPYPRRTRTICVGIDQDAYRLLIAMVPPSHVGMGQLISEWVRKEARERVQRAQWVQALQRQADATALGPDGEHGLD